MPSTYGHHQWIALFLTWCGFIASQDTIFASPFIHHTTAIYRPPHSAFTFSPFYSSLSFLFTQKQQIKMKRWRGSNSTLPSEVVGHEIPSSHNPHRAPRSQDAAEENPDDTLMGESHLPPWPF
ncbi:hypothetical protein J3F83DRAFT_724525 [Trichoderma novae-zelandiae]